MKKTSEATLDYIMNRPKLIMEKKNKMKEMPRVSFGIDLCDRNIGGAKDVDGIAFGSCVQLAGQKGCGKSALATETIVSGLMQYGKKCKYNYDDPEDGNSIDTMTRYGFELKPEDITKTSHTIEELDVNINTFADSLEEDEVGIYVIDSLDNMTTQEIMDRGEKRLKKAEEGKTLDEGSYLMAKQKYLSSEFFPRIKPLIMRKKVLLIFISQVRDNVGAMVGPRTKTSGGRALEHMMDFVINLRPTEKMEVAYKKSKRQVGARVLFDTKMKARSARPYRSNYFVYYFSTGLDNVQSNVEFYFDLITEKGQTGKRCNVKWDDQEFKTIDAVVKYIYENDQEKQIAECAISKWEEIEDAVAEKVSGRKGRRVNLFEED